MNPYISAPKNLLYFSLFLLLMERWKVCYDYSLSISGFAMTTAR
mgnify:CR=1 FL=1